MYTEDELFRSIYKAHMPMLHMIAQKRGIPVDDIEDLIQDTFAAYYSHYPLTWNEYKIKAMLARIMKNRCVDYLRRRECRPIVYYDPTMAGSEVLLTEDLIDRDSLSVLMERQEFRAVMEALSSMRGDWREVLWMHVIEGRPMAEIGEILGISEAACRTRLCRGRKCLKAMLEQAARGNGQTKNTSPEDKPKPSQLEGRRSGEAREGHASA